MVKLGFWFSLLALTVLVAPAEAASHDAKERAARRACLNGDPAKGVQILTELYITSDNPTYLYNQGRCYEQNNRYEEAIGRFREFLRKTSKATNVDKADATSAEKHIADCEAFLGRKVTDPAQPTALPPPPPPQPAPPPQIAPLPQPVPPVNVVQRQPAPPTPTSSGRGLRVAGVVTVAVGAAALVTGVVLNIKANNMVSDVQSRYDSGAYSSSKDYKIGSQVAYGAGAVCVAGGLLLYYFGVRAEHVAVTPMALKDGAGAMLTGAF
jgi:tetratricopeptide (TPR) repeat protein